MESRRRVRENLNQYSTSSKSILRFFGLISLGLFFGEKLGNADIRCVLLLEKERFLDDDSLPHKISDLH